MFMKIRFVSIVAIAGLFMLSFLSCEKEDEKLDFYLVDVQADTDWDYLAFSKDGSYLLIQQENSIPTQMYFVPEKENDGYPIFLDDEGFPSMAVIDGHIFLFSKADDTHVDIAMVTPGGEILITRGIEHGADWSEVGTKSADAEESLASMTRWAGRVASVVGCGLSIKAAVATGGAAIPLAKWGCGAMVVSFASQAVDAEALGLSSDVVGVGVSLIGCPGDPVGCVIGIGSFASGFVADALDARDRNQSNVRAAQGALSGGHGDVQVTLTWNNIADIDLHVIDPGGVEIYYARRTSPSGGQLDYDNTYGYGPENIFWPPGSAPQGTYQVFVNHYSGSNASQYTVLVNAFGHFASFQGTVQPRQKLFVTNFSPSGIGGKSVQDPVEVPYVEGPAK
jgi:hypothetical protein